jgi:hypothetical protein
MTPCAPRRSAERRASSPGALRRAVLTAVLASFAASPAAAQTGPVTLQIRPRAGDTLRLRLDQTVEMVGTTRNGENDLTTSESHTMVVLTRLAVEATDLEGATVTALTDSVRLTSTPPRDGQPMLGWARAMQGQRFRFRVALDGTTSPSPDAAGASRLSAFLAQLPATLPKEAILPGATWSRAMEIPLATPAERRGTATMTATFRFDSLSRSGDLAFLSVKGRISRSTPAQRGATPAADMGGTMSGAVIVDRRRGWITDARALVNVRSLVYGSRPGSPPVKVRMRITQWMRVQ